MHTNTTHSHTVTVNGTDLELVLPVTPSTAMIFTDPLEHVGTDKITVGYLADDPDVENPLDEEYSAIYEARRHGGTLSDYCEALGVHNDGSGPNLDLVDEAEVVKAALALIHSDNNLTYTAYQHCLVYWTQDKDESDDEFIDNCLDSINELTPVMDVPALQLELWRAGRAAGTIGAKYTVMLDVYEHGGVAYSVSGSGMQCRFDTARGGAVWVAGEARVAELDALPEDQRAARLVELAKADAAQYTAWRNGDCYFYVIAEFSLEGEELDYNTCGGYIGTDDAMSALKDEMPAAT